MMLGIEDYGSDASDTELDHQPTSTAPSKPLPGGLSLPPPKSASALSLPAPKTKRAPKKITIGLPSLPDHPREEEEDERPAAKKPRLGSGAGASSLLGMLPAPKQKVPVLAAPERVLGGGKGPGLVFNTSRAKTIYTPSVVEDNDAASTSLEPTTAEEPAQSSSMAFLPPSLKKGRSNISLEEGGMPSKPSAAPKASAAPAVDFFSLGNVASSSRPKAIPSAAAPVSSHLATSSTSATPSFSSAPAIQEFTPPEPTPEDEYPGYYQLPSGSWAAHDSAYYKTFYDKWTKTYNAHVRALEKGSAKGFEGYDEDGGAQEVNMAKEMELAKEQIKDREDKKALTHGAAKEGQLAAPKMNIQGAKMGKMARGRHQLTTLLAEAYQNREALEDQIAAGKRNRKEAGNKYGF
ncbi:hypothetical protein FIBSPDRAFT_932785 [Athelia psychrophila]|uniref:Mitotic checkpoint regulator, MAD2B-interacting-domain-containing protein n=1 Tax=Athelia psychrophila TaxID=1759441 RepID=A0A166I277_9AGAM|nr:hypothetical protein FIBSPDRAFT_932785 [Fibularhizoctonia sp. CBS 109695]